MRKTLLVITVLFVATQAYAGTVTMSVDDISVGTDRWAAIRYSADANVSAFGLKIYADSGAIITDIDDYNVGECTAAVQGYGIFPGTIDINEETGVVDGNGTPIAPPWDPCSHTGPTGLNTNTIIVEMGALYEEGNEPALSGTLFSIKVDSDCTVCVETESIRGNVVLTDANEASVFYSPNCVALVIEYDYGDANDPTYPTLWASTGARHLIVDGVYLGPGPQATSLDAESDGQPNATATGDDIAGPSVNDEDGVVCPVVLVKGGATNVTVTASVTGYLNAWLDLNADGDWADGGEQIFTDQSLSAGANVLQINVGCGATNGVTFSRWRFTTYDTSGALSYVGEANDGEVEDHNHVIVCHVPDVVGDPCDDAIAELNAACFTIDITTVYSDTVPYDRVISTDPPYCTYGGCDVNIVVSQGSDCYLGMPQADIDEWIAVGRPVCWCYPRQCHGDADGLAFGTKSPFYWVATDDLAILKSAWLKEIENMSGNEICADFDRQAFGTKSPFYRVSTADLTILKTNWLIPDGPAGDCQPGNRTP